MEESIVNSYLETCIPLTFSERQIAIEQYMAPDSVAYNINLLFEITGSLDKNKLRKTLSEIVARHSAFRSYYEMIKGDIVHKVLPVLKVKLRTISCSIDDIQVLINKENLPYNLSKSPLFRFTLLVTDQKKKFFHLNIHHIIIDKASIDIFFDELMTIYNGKKLPHVTYDFHDYAIKYKESNDITGEVFFKDLFFDGVPNNEMPLSCKRLSTLPYATEDSIGEIDFLPLSKAAMKYKVTPFKLCLSAVGLVLSKYCGSDDVTIGVAMNGRSLPETKGIIGMFANTLPVRLKTTADMLIIDYIKNTADIVSKVKKLQTFPLEKIVSLLAIERLPSRNPIFDVIVNYLEETRIPAATGLSIKEAQIKRQALSIDIQIEFLHDGDKLNIILSYSKKLYFEEIIKNMMDQLVSIIKKFTILSEESTLLEINDLPTIQKQQILRNFAGKRSKENVDKTMIELFREQVKRTPKNDAIVFINKTLTYMELDEISDIIAHAVINHGRIVGVLVNRSEMTPICALGIIKAGAIYLPLDPSYPSDRLEFMIEESGVSMIIANKENLDLIPNYQGEFLFTHDIENLFNKRSCIVLDNQTLPFNTMKVHNRIKLKNFTPESMMVILYTSGTTGKPKGVILSHKNIINFTTWYKNYNSITEKDRVSALASFGFDAHILDFYPALISGACVHIIPDTMRLDLKELNDYFTKNNISITLLTTQLGRQFIQDTNNKSLRSLLVGGETLAPIEPPQNYTFHNAYGPTECSVMATVFQVDKLYDKIPIGKPLDNTALYVVDKQLHLVPIGVLGELCIAGRQVSKGYLNRPEITAEKFVLNPFTKDQEYAIMYRTGDIARFLPDGNIDIVGRSDLQVKIRGFRIELQEIEKSIQSFPNVRNAIAIASDAPSGDKCVVAYIVADNLISVDDLNNYLGQSLPSYMIPTSTMQIEKIPLSQNGKIDYKSLPSPVFYQSKVENTAHIKNDLEKHISQIIAKILGHEQFELKTNLLKTGLNSLSCIKLITELGNKYGVNILVRDILKNPNLLGIENIITSKLISKDNTVVNPEKPLLYPLSQNQMGIFYDCIKNSNSTIYNVPFYISIKKNCDINVLKNSIKKVIKNHSALYTRILMEDEKVLQTISDEEIVIETIYISEVEKKKLLLSFVKPFLLIDKPLIRCKIFKTEKETYLLFDFHHIVFDGISFNIFLNEIAAMIKNPNFILKKEASTSFNYALWESDQVKTNEYNNAKTYFKKMMNNNYEVSSLQSDYNKNQDKKDTSKMVILPIKKTEICNSFLSENVTISNLFLGAVCFVTSKFTYKQNIGIATISSGRQDYKLHNTIGMFVKTLPFIIQVNSLQTVDSYLKTIQEMMLNTVAHEIYPFTQIVSEHNFHPQIMFTFQGNIVEYPEIEDKPIIVERMHNNSQKFPIEIAVEEDRISYQIMIKFDSSRFSIQTMITYLECVKHIVTSFSAHLSKPLSCFSIANDKQMKKVNSFSNNIEELSPHMKNESVNNRSIIDYHQSFMRNDKSNLSIPLSKEYLDCNKIENFNSTLCAVHKYFEIQAVEHPNRCAVLAKDTTLSYKELNIRANQVANKLIKSGVKKGDVIAILLPRTSHIFIAIYGILKAGAVFVPIDPTYPEERITYIIKDCEAKYIISDKDMLYGNTLNINNLLLYKEKTNPNVPISSNDTCYIIYTSGTTGKPKGVLITHGNVKNYITFSPRNILVFYSVKQKTTFLSASTVSFDAFLVGVFIQFSFGLKMVLATEDEIRNPILLANLCKKTKVNSTSLTPSVISNYLEYQEMCDAFTRFKVIELGGEKFPSSIYKSLRSITKAVIVNAYGPSETTISCNAKIIEDENNITIGPPEYGVEEQIIDIDNQPLPLGAIGELCIGGAGVCKGYLNNPKLTQEKFFIYNDKKYYKSGDLAKWTKNGEVILFGRNDNQIKLRGLRIELGEIENAILENKNITRVIVLVRKIDNREHICSYFMSKKKINIDKLRKNLSKTLPLYMVPSLFVPLQKIPLTQNGKVDENFLPVPIMTKVEDYEEPQTKIEEDFCEIFTNALKIEKVGKNNNFFQLGGTSLLVTQLIVGAKNKGYIIDYGDVFQNSTPKELANLICNKTCPKSLGTDVEYDYTKINELLSKNTIQSMINGEMRKIGNVLLTGSTGFLGIHFLNEFLQTRKGNVYCIIRSSKVCAKQRLKTLLAYYFENDYADLFEDRLFVIEGDITDSKIFSNIIKYPIDTYVNCAASVKHFSEGTDIDEININGVENAIRFCEKKKCRLIQISTCSIAGFRIDNQPNKEMKLDERKLFFGQELSNKYIHSKFIAERIILEAISKGLEAKIIRVGNLMARSNDGDFQINFNTNSFLGKLRAYCLLGCIPFEDLNNPVEFSAIDYTAKGILVLSETPSKCIVYNLFNNHIVFFRDIVNTMKLAGININKTEHEEWILVYDKLLNDETIVKYLLPLFAYKTNEKKEVSEPIASTNEYTMQCLDRLGFSWPIVTEDYLYRFIVAMKELGYL